MPASLVQAGFILVYQTRFNTSLQLHLLSFFSSLIMELGARPSHARRRLWGHKGAGSPPPLLACDAGQVCVIASVLPSSSIQSRAVTSGHAPGCRRADRATAGAAAGRWLEGASLQRCAWESMLLATLGVVAPLALSLYWEANFRRHLVQRQLAGKLAGDRPCAKQRVGPFWSFLLGV